MNKLWELFTIKCQYCRHYPFCGIAYDVIEKQKYSFMFSNYKPIEDDKILEEEELNNFE